ncbi:unnamed protein product [Owenia fusiformis]|uniref:SCD domain-containing protein n=1 Tax=Owenia fusiformis TaxID=6347 RepID=A0A8S4NLT7_OWEFU|nr:unnamed protein product [Owenia fusiformis]CAH1781722.1 unnamed protein product [Owenia fusiformis]
MPGVTRPRRLSRDAASKSNIADTMESIIQQQAEGEMDSEMEHIMEPTSELGVPEQEDSDFEEPKAAGAKRKRQKKDETMVKKARKVPEAGGGRGRKKKQIDPNAEDQDGSLFEVVKSGKTALQAVVDDWIEGYKSDRDTALLELIQFFIQCSGCKGRITPHMYANMEHAEIIRKMTEEFDEDSGDYPLIMTGAPWKKFKTSFCEFVQVLVRQCQYSIIYDQYMMDNVISLLTGLTDSQVRAFRHTSTLAAMKLMTALVDVALNLSINLDNTQRQYEAERQKNQSKRASERLEMLMAKRQELEENQEEIRNMLTYIFKGVFVHRYRDTQAEIRNICMSEIGVWMKRYPNMFLDDSYLKYVGWTMYDRTGDVRSGCLKCLMPLYEAEELAPKLELFTNRFKARLVEMTLDKEYDVAVAAVKLSTAILKYNEQVLTDKDCENVYELVYSSHRQVAQSAGEFLNVKLFQKDEESMKNVKTKKGKKRSVNTPLVRDLVQFFIESELHEHGAYLVDSMFEVNDMMRDWECMTDLLIEEPGRGEEVMDDRQESSLIELMVCAVKQAATGESPVGRGPNKKLSSRENRQVMEDKTKLTEHFIVTLPQLLAKYSADPEKVANLLTIPQHFDLEIYTTSRQEKHLDTLLRQIQDIIEKHTDTEVLEVCSKCLEAFCQEEYAISGKCQITRSTLIDAQVEKFREAFQDFFAEGEEPDEDEAYALHAALKRVYAMWGCHDLTNWKLWDSLFHIVRMGNEHPELPAELMVKALACCSLAVVWSLQQLNENEPSKEAMLGVKEHLKEMMNACMEALFHTQDRVNEEAFITICDLLIVFSKHMGNPLFAPLIFEPDKHMQAKLSGFVNEKVFIDDDDDETDENIKIEELHKRRNFLASFCKLVIYNVISIKAATDMFKQYMKYYNDYGDIIKATLSKSREINKVATAKTMAKGLTNAFSEVKLEQNNVDRSSEGFIQIKELARRFALSFGLDQIKNREAVAAMHKEGILFALNPMENPDDPNGAPPNVAFLEILTEFCSRLMKQDKKTVVTYLDKHLSHGIPASRSDDWLPLLTYRNSLVQGEEEETVIPPGPGALYKNKVGRPKGGRHKKRGAAVPEASGFQTPAGRMGGPQTSTAIKRPRHDEESVGSDNLSEQGSERDFQDSTMNISHISQASWLAQKQQESLRQQQQQQSYGRVTRGRPPAPPGQMSMMSPGSNVSIGSFESPQSIPPQRPRFDEPSSHIVSSEVDMQHF